MSFDKVMLHPRDLRAIPGYASANETNSRSVEIAEVVKISEKFSLSFENVNGV